MDFLEIERYDSSHIGYLMAWRIGTEGDKMCSPSQLLWMDSLLGSIEQIKAILGFLDPASIDHTLY